MIDLSLTLTLPYFILSYCSSLLEELKPNLHQYLRDASKCIVLKMGLDQNEQGLFDMVVQRCDGIRKGGDGQNRQKIELSIPSPSLDGKQFKELQKKWSILCHRPPHCSGLHVSLQVEAFGKFIDLLEGPYRPEYYSLSLDLMMVMSNFF